ncbi:ribosomal RNA small subunit methyltransferase H-like [Salvia splendens]|uniref:ribosomal RNA small subunit methyltransferase H-like n=1 Tax=Salvia splendens TaxID=180675 RepID=UPI001102E651|nr:ribosomal RNA small subunit methyltransferase H-like [Salvia splendens]
MALPAASASAQSIFKKLLLLNSPQKIILARFSTSYTARAVNSAVRNKGKSKSKIKSEPNQQQKQKAELLVKRRTRSDRELDEDVFSKHYGDDTSAHVPVMIGEVLDVFATVNLKSFVDCTLGAGGHSAAIIQAHPEMEFYVGFDVDPVAHQIAQNKINNVLDKDSGHSRAHLQVHTLVKNFKSIKTALHDIDENRSPGVQGILMDLGMSSMQVNNAERGFSVLCEGPLDMRMNPQASLKAEDILNLWPDAELGRILRDYGEESNWFTLHKRIVRVRSTGGLHTTHQLVDLIRNSSSSAKGGGRQGWIKTATRVFQALRIAVNDELNTLKDSINSCFDSLGPGGRLAVISFHSLEDRIVKQAFLDIINHSDDGAKQLNHSEKLDSYKEKEAWIKQIVRGKDGNILTKRPVTPSESEERLNPRSRSAKLRVIEKV